MERGIRKVLPGFGEIDSDRVSSYRPVLLVGRLPVSELEMNKDETDGDIVREPWR